MDDLFGDIPQPKRQGKTEGRKPLTAEDVRGMMIDLIRGLREADTVPFDQREFEKHIAMFPIMAQWLPGDEGKQLVFEFEREVERLRKTA
ncbi:MAG TPA: hypothetical protein VFK86_17525 [Bauldia sp.]|nr:hypothetical protein [Bauldia sp.]